MKVSKPFSPIWSIEESIVLLHHVRWVTVIVSSPWSEHQLSYQLFWNCIMYKCQFIEIPPSPISTAESGYTGKHRIGKVTLIRMPDSFHSSLLCLTHIAPSSAIWGAHTGQTTTLTPSDFFPPLSFEKVLVKMDRTFHIMVNPARDRTARYRET